ncbi:hypothetical protein TD95_000910 [Thielaviopsis punctulata]|uniref:Pyrroloquinoline quinone-dependent pyranose dehydrogenase beta-propeller domain-containing protein n=1 Tax=Thielaviopsis punctulata TaxID=72032 RepID=A0A0F4ZGD0_9PEZI|nr:hypothetical protein TD95_000910 [Thielaviopsis punctulata]
MGALLGAVYAQGPLPNSCHGVSPSILSLSTTPGWKAVKIAGNYTRPRGVKVDTKGNLLVVDWGRGVIANTFGSDGCIASSKVLIDNTDLNHGIEVTPTGKFLLVSSMTTIWRYDYDPVTLTVSNPKVVVKDMFDGGYPSRTLLIPPATPDLVAVQLGSATNIELDTYDMSSGRAMVKVFNLETAPTGGWDWLTQGMQLGYGLRNDVGLVVDGNNNVWSLENSADDLVREVDGKKFDVHTNNPTEELNFLGSPQVTNNKWYGYPYCFTVGDPKAFPYTNFTVGDQFVQAPNATMNDTTCALRSEPPRFNIPAHSAPIDGKFDAEFDYMYVSLHGSWNRSPPTGYKVIRVPFSKSLQGIYPTAGNESIDGFEDVLWSNNVSECSSRTCLRPSGISWDRAYSRIYVASDNDAEGEVYVLYEA